MSHLTSSDERPDEDLVRDTLDGDQAAYAVLVDRYGDRLYSTVYRLVGSAEDARDLVQDTFIKAYQNLSGFRGGSKVYTWLYRIAVNTSLSHRRRRRPIQLTDPATNPAAENPGPTGLKHTPDDPADRLVTEETEQMVQRAIDELDPEHRTVVVLRDIQQMEYAQIADVLEVPTGTVKSRLHRARMILKDKLQTLLEA